MRNAKLIREQKSIFLQDDVAGRIIECDPEMGENGTAELPVDVVVAGATGRLSRRNRGAADPEPFVRTNDAGQ